MVQTAAPAGTPTSLRISRLASRVGDKERRIPGEVRTARQDTPQQRPAHREPASGSHSHPVKRLCPTSLQAPSSDGAQACWGKGGAMDVAFAFDATYASYLPGAVESVLRTNTQVELWLAATPAAVSVVEKQLVRQVSTRAAIHYLIMDESRLQLGTSVLAELSYISAGANLRLFLADAMPAHVTRFLYLDIDVLVHADLSPLWHVPLGDAVVGAVRDRGTPFMGSHGGPPGLSADLDPASPYFNSGVLLVNPAQWRRRDITRRCIDYLVRYRDRLRYPDQDGLNIVCYGAWLELDDTWNYQYARPGPDEPRPCRDGIRITHYAGNRKPWDADFPAEEHRRRYLEIVDHANVRLIRR